MNTMSKKPLNAEEVAELRGSPYIASIISGKINFTPEFGHPYKTPSTEELHKRLDTCIEKYNAWTTLNE